MLRGARLVLMLCPLLVMLGACVRPGPTATVSAVVIVQVDTTLLPGESLSLSATVTAAGGAAEGVTWSSSDGSIASVTADGVVAAVAAGVAVVIATSDFDSDV